MGTRLYTKTGDQGQTSLLGGKRVSKSAPRIDAYGHVDELNSFLGWLKDQVTVENQLKQQIHWIQEHLFTIGSTLAAEPGFSGFELPQISKKEVSQLEIWMDKYDSEIPPLKNFILPGGHPAISLTHVCRSVCRRTERSVIALAEVEEIDKVIIRFLNRLSDYLFIFARVLAQRLKIVEVPWLPNTD